MPAASVEAAHVEAEDTRTGVGSRDLSGGGDIADGDGDLGCVRRSSAWQQSEMWVAVASPAQAHAWSLFYFPFGISQIFHQLGLRFGASTFLTRVSPKVAQLSHVYLNG